MGRFEWFGRCLDLCESYIERRFLIELVIMRDRFDEWHGDRDAIGRDKDGLTLFQQLDVYGDRVDFAMMLGERRLIIELDGAAYHDEHKDAARDERLTREGWDVIRFTGAEVNKSVKACVKRVLDHFQDGIVAARKVKKAQPPVRFRDLSGRPMELPPLPVAKELTDEEKADLERTKEALLAALDKL